MSEEHGAQKNTTIKDVMLDIARAALGVQYADVLPQGFSIYLVAEYDPKRFPAPNLWLEKRAKPHAKYVAILSSDTASVPALGETISDAINEALLKIERQHVGH